MKFKKILSIGLAVALLISATTMNTSFATENKNGTNLTVMNTTAAGVSSKSEVVYAKLSTEGAVNAVYVVNHYEVVKGGNITDYGNYSSVKNLSESTPIAIEGDKITLQAEEGDFYYQGNMDMT
ncbi:MAG: hypothetical protein K0R34_3077, partial [Herbinix sp.]|nr:hypothetical protein [Herbinix sp.]